MTLDEVDAGLRARGLSRSGWALANGYHASVVTEAVLSSSKPRAAGKPRGAKPVLYQKILAELEATLNQPTAEEAKMPHENH